MKCKISLTIFLFFLSFLSLSQDTLLRYDKYDKVVYKGKTPLNMDKLFVLMRPDKETFELIESARDCKFYSRVLGGLGGFPVGFAIGYFLPTNDFKWPIFAVGAGLIAISIPLHFRYLKQTQRAVLSYNSKLDKTYFQKEKLELSLANSIYGLGLRLTFN